VNRFADSPTLRPSPRVLTSPAREAQERLLKGKQDELLIRSSVPSARPGPRYRLSKRHREEIVSPTLWRIGAASLILFPRWGTRRDGSSGSPLRSSFPSARRVGRSSSCCNVPGRRVKSAA
jgi:hypothetical protein